MPLVEDIRQRLFSEGRDALATHIIYKQKFVGFGETAGEAGTRNSWRNTSYESSSFEQSGSVSSMFQKLEIEIIL